MAAGSPSLLLLNGHTGAQPDAISIAAAARLRHMPLTSYAVYADGEQVLRMIHSPCCGALAPALLSTLDRQRSCLMSWSRRHRKNKCSAALLQPRPGSGGRSQHSGLTAHCSKQRVMRFGEDALCNVKYCPQANLKVYRRCLRTAGRRQLSQACLTARGMLTFDFCSPPHTVRRAPGPPVALAA